MLIELSLCDIFDLFKLTSEMTRQHKSFYNTYVYRSKNAPGSHSFDRVYAIGAYLLDKCLINSFVNFV